MNQDTDNANHPELDGQLEIAVWAVLSEPVPVAAVERVKRQALETKPALTGLKVRVQSQRRFSAVTRLALAACVLIAIIGGFALSGIPFGNSNVYALAAKRLESLTSLVCRVQFSSTGSMTNFVSMQGNQEVTYLAPGLHRIEDLRHGTVQIVDRETDRTVLLMPDARQAIVVEGGAAVALDANSPARMVETLLQHFRADRIDDENVKSLGTRKQDDVTLQGYESNLGGEVVRAWFDTHSHAPVWVAIRLPIPPHMTDSVAVPMWYVMSDIQLNVEVAREQFSTSVPDGYQPLVVGNVSRDPSIATLDDIIEMLRLCADANDSVFPLWLSIDDYDGTPLAIQNRFAASLEQQVNEGSKAEKEAAMDSLQKFAGAVGRAMAFQFTVKPENDWHYFGGAKRGDVDRPLLWYSPEADDHYTVVFADLTVRQLIRDNLPPKPAAVLRAARPENTIRVSTPRFDLPATAVRDFAQLQQIRTGGKQSEVEYLSLMAMPEFIESQIQHDSDAEPILREVDPGWKPNRAGSSSRLAFLGEFTNLKGLDLSHLYLTQSDLDTIGSCTSLRLLSLSGVHIFDATSRRIVADDLAKLSSLQSLELLELSQSNFTGGLRHLQELPSLHTLYLSSFEHLNDTTIEELGVLPHLETLILAPVYGTNPKTTVTEQGLAHLQRLSRLRTLYVGYHGKWTLPIDRLRELLPNVDVQSPTEGLETSH